MGRSTVTTKIFFSTWTVALCCLAICESSAHATPPHDLLVSARFGNNLLRYSGASGAFQRQFNMGGGLSNPAGVAYDANGYLYMANFNTNQVMRFAPDGTFVQVFSSNFDAPGFGLPLALTFGPDHNLYVTSNVTAGVYAFSGTTGAFIRVAASGNGLAGATGLTFVPNGELFVSSAGTNQILRFDGTSGAFLGAFGTGVTLSNPTDMKVGPDGALYVASTLNNRIHRYDLTTGVGQVFATGFSRPIGLAFDPGGNLYVANQLGNNVLRFASNGDPLGVFVSAGSGGLNGPNYMVFAPAQPDCDGNGLFELSQDTACFIDVLIGINTDPAAIDRNDFTGDSLANGLDIPGFVNCVLNGCS